MSYINYYCFLNPVIFLLTLYELYTDYRVLVYIMDYFTLYTDKIKKNLYIVYFNSEI